jgi:hypothetical protein
MTAAGAGADGTFDEVIKWFPSTLLRPTPPIPLEQTWPLWCLAESSNDR